MKKTIITLTAVCVLGAASLLSSCTGNTVTDGDTDMPSESVSDKETDNNIIDDAESKLEDMSEDATHGTEDGTPGASSRGGSGFVPRGK